MGKPVVIEPGEVGELAEDRGNEISMGIEHPDATTVPDVAQDHVLKQGGFAYAGFPEEPHVTLTRAHGMGASTVERIHQGNNESRRYTLVGRVLVETRGP